MYICKVTLFVIFIYLKGEIFVFKKRYLLELHSALRHIFIRSAFCDLHCFVLQNARKIYTEQTSLSSLKIFNGFVNHAKIRDFLCSKTL